MPLLAEVSVVEEDRFTQLADGQLLAYYRSLPQELAHFFKEAPTLLADLQVKEHQKCESYSEKPL